MTDLLMTSCMHARPRHHRVGAGAWQNRIFDTYCLWFLTEDTGAKKQKIKWYFVKHLCVSRLLRFLPMPILYRSKQDFLCSFQVAHSLRFKQRRTAHTVNNWKVPGHSLPLRPYRKHSKSTPIEIHFWHFHYHKLSSKELLTTMRGWRVSREGAATCALGCSSIVFEPFLTSRVP